MKSEAFKKLIKESVKEAIREELISSLVEVLNNKSNLITGTNNIPVDLDISKTNKLGLKEEIRNKIPKPDFKFTSNNISQIVGQPTPNLHSNQPYNPGNVNTSGNGSALPEGEVSMDQISKLMKT